MGMRQDHTATESTGSPRPFLRCSRAVTLPGCVGHRWPEENRDVLGSPPFEFARRGGLHLAYQQAGDGPVRPGLRGRSRGGFVALGGAGAEPEPASHGQLRPPGHLRPTGHGLLGPHGPVLAADHRRPGGRPRGRRGGGRGTRPGPLRHPQRRGRGRALRQPPPGAPDSCFATRGPASSAATTSRSECPAMSSTSWPSATEPSGVAARSRTSTPPGASPAREARPSWPRPATTRLNHLFHLNRTYDIRACSPRSRHPRSSSTSRTTRASRPTTAATSRRPFPGHDSYCCPGADHDFLQNLRPPVIDEVERFTTGRVTPFRRPVAHHHACSRTSSARRRTPRRWATSAGPR